MKVPKFRYEGNLYYVSDTSVYSDVAVIIHFYVGYGLAASVVCFSTPLEDAIDVAVDLISDAGIAPGIFVDDEVAELYEEALEEGKSEEEAWEYAEADTTIAGNYGRHISDWSYEEIDSDDPRFRLALTALRKDERKTSRHNRLAQARNFFGQPQDVISYWGYGGIAQEVAKGNEKAVRFVKALASQAKSKYSGKEAQDALVRIDQAYERQSGYGKAARARWTYEKRRK